MVPPERLNELAAPEAMLCSGGGKTLYIGCLDQVDWHRHGVAAFVVGVAGSFRLGCPSGRWLTCKAALIPAGVRHALDIGGDPLAVLYPEPTVANLSQLARLGHAWNETEQILTGQRASIATFRELYESRASSLHFVGEALDDLVRFAQAGNGPPVLDPRIARVVGRLGTNPSDLTAITTLVEAEGLSVSRFLHLFKREIGVPFRRFRIWNRLRAATAVALAGGSLTEAALSAGFADSSHFARLHRETFGLSASYTLRRLARVGILTDSHFRILVGKNGGDMPDRRFRYRLRRYGEARRRCSPSARLPPPGAGR